MINNDLQGHMSTVCSLRVTQLSLGLTMKLLILISFIPAGLALRPEHARTFDLLSVAFNG